MLNFQKWHLVVPDAIKKGRICMLEFHPLSAPSLKELFVHEMESTILSGRLKIGDKIPSERELSESMHISRSVVNSGLVEMAHKGFLEIRPRSGTYVADFRLNGTVETMVSVMQFNGGQLPKHTIYSFVELRGNLKKLAAEKVCLNAEPDELIRLRRLMEELSAADSPSRAAVAATDLDHAIASVSGNDVLPMIFASWRTCSISIFTRYFEKEGILPYYAGLERKVWESMRDGNVTACLAAIDEGSSHAVSGHSGIG
jgi:GntR family transcriptional repressor for pyruvate dehydrogenase complex